MIRGRSCSGWRIEERVDGREWRVDRGPSTVCFRGRGRQAMHLAMVVVVAAAAVMRFGGNSLVDHMTSFFHDDITPSPAPTCQFERVHEPARASIAHSARHTNTKGVSRAAHHCNSVFFARNVQPGGPPCSTTGMSMRCCMTGNERLDEDSLHLYATPTHIGKDNNVFGSQRNACVYVATIAPLQTPRT